MPIIEIVLVVLAAVAIGYAVLRRARRSGCGDTCEAKGGCGCTPSTTD